MAGGAAGARGSPSPRSTSSSSGTWSPRSRSAGPASAYVVDARGQLIAHPDISLVLKKSDLSGLQQVQAASRAAGRGTRRGRRDDLRPATSRGAGCSPRTPDHPAGLARSRGAAARGSLRDPARLDHRTVLLGSPASGCPCLASLVLARRMVRPIRALGAGAARIGAGDLGQRIAGPDRGRDRGAGRRVQPHGGHAPGVLRRAGAQGRRAHERAARGAGAADGDRRDPARDQSSPTDLQPVQDASLENIAARLCEAERSRASIRYRRRRAAAPAAMARRPVRAVVPLRTAGRPSRRNDDPGLAALERRAVHVPDLLDEVRRSPELKPIQKCDRAADDPGRAAAARKARSIGVITTSGAWRCGRSRTSRSRCWRPSPTRPSSPSRTCGCSRSCKRAPGSSPSRWRSADVQRGRPGAQLLPRSAARAGDRGQPAVKLSGCDACGIFEFDAGRPSVFEVVASHNLREACLAVGAGPRVPMPGRSAIWGAAETRTAGPGS